MDILTSGNDIGIFTVGGERMDIYGASGAVPRDDLDRMDAHAEMYYEEIRKRKSDIKAIAKNVKGLGFTVYKQYAVDLDREAGIR